MILENQVVSLELAKKLKELGVVQQACFFWVVNPWGDAQLAESGFYQLPYKWWHKTNWAAFTVAELANLIFKSVPSGNYVLEAYGHVFNVPSTQIITELGLMECMRNPDISAKMLIHLIENNLIQL